MSRIPDPRLVRAATWDAAAARLTSRARDLEARAPSTARVLDHEAEWCRAAARRLHENIRKDALDALAAEDAPLIAEEPRP